MKYTRGTLGDVEYKGGRGHGGTGLGFGVE